MDWRMLLRVGVIGEEIWEGGKRVFKEERKVGRKTVVSGCALACAVCRVCV